MSKLTSGFAALVFAAVTVVSAPVSAGWLSDTIGNAFGTADLVAAGKKWDALSIESEDGLETVTFLPAGQTADEASETLTFTAAVEEVTSSAYDAQAVIDQNNSDGNTKSYKSEVSPQNQSVRARGLYIKVPGRSYSQLFSLKGAYLSDGLKFFGVTYRINIVSDSEIAKQPEESLDIMDDRIKNISTKQIQDWFKYFHEKAKKRLAAKQKAKAPQS